MIYLMFYLLDLPSVVLFYLMFYYVSNKTVKDRIKYSVYSILYPFGSAGRTLRVHARFSVDKS